MIYEYGEGVLRIDKATASALDEILAQHMADAELLEASIAELECELLECLNDWREGAIQLRLTEARDLLAREIGAAAEVLGTINAVRAQRGMERHLMSRVVEGEK